VAGAAPCSFVPLLRAWLPFEFCDEDDLTAERLKTTKAVLLSHVICLGEAKLALLREFVHSGGCVIAESATARRDDDGRLYPQTRKASARCSGSDGRRRTSPGDRR